MKKTKTVLIKKKPTPQTGRIPVKEWKKLTQEERDRFIQNRKLAPKVERALALKDKYKTQGTDPRVDQNTASQGAILIVPNQTTVIDRKVLLNPDALLAVLLGMFNQFNEYGYYASLADKQDAYYALRYVYDYLVSCASNGTVTISKAPMCLRLLCDALSPKRRRFKTGEMYYSWNVVNAQDYPIPYQIGSTLITHMGVPDTNVTVNQFPTLANGNAYSVEAGSAAYQGLIAFLDSLTTGGSMLKVGSTTESTILKDDVSAFAYVFSELGASQYGGVGGYNSETYLQTKITSPLLSVFNLWTDSSAAAVEMHVTAGGGFCTGARLVTLKEPIQIRDKPKTIFKKVDMNDIYALLSFLVGTAVERAATNNATTGAVFTCPLSSQQIHLLLRVAIAATNYKVIGADILEGVPFPLPVDFRPLQWSFANANPATNARSIMLPTVLVENLHSLAPTVINLDNKMKKGRKQVLWAQAVFGYWGNKLGNFTTTQGPLYSTIPGEVDIDIPNMTANVLPSSPVVNLAGEQLDTYITTWNEWVGSLDQYIALSPVGTCKGTSALKSVMITRYVTPQQANPQVSTELKGRAPTIKEARASREMKVFGKGLARKLKVVNVDPPLDGLSQNVEAVTSNQPLVESAWRLVQGHWVLPKEFVYGVDAQEQIRNRAIVNIEPHFLWNTGVFSNVQVNFPELFTSFREIAESFATAFQAKETEVQVGFKKMIESGEGGFLGSLIGDFAGNALNMPLLSQLGAVIPF